MIDAHTHCFPNDPFSNSKVWAQTNKEDYWLRLVAPNKKSSLQRWNTKEQTLKVMDDANIEKIVLLGWYWEHESTCLWHNQLMQSWFKEAPDKFIGFASILPNHSILKQLEIAKSMGFRGVGELHPSVQNFSGNKRHWYQMAEWCIQENWPINIHVTESLNLPHSAYTQTPFQFYLDLAIAFPELKIILAHWGGGIPFFEQNPKLKPLLKNVYYDTAASPLLYDMIIFKNVISMVGIEKIIFGSDYPLNLYPNYQAEADIKTFIQAVHTDADLSPEAMNSLFKETITNILGSH